MASYKYFRRLYSPLIKEGVALKKDLHHLILIKVNYIRYKEAQQRIYSSHHLNGSFLFMLSIMHLLIQITPFVRINRI